MRSIALAVLFTSALVLAPAVEACSTSAADVDTGATPAGRVYLVNDECQPGCAVSAHVYVESNGRAGLQRADDWADDTCGGTSRPDTLIF